MSKSTKWNITTSGDRPLRDVQMDVKGAGFSIEHSLKEIGVITGTASEAIAKKLRAIPGIADVSPAQDIDIGPPDSPVT